MMTDPDRDAASREEESKSRAAPGHSWVCEEVANVSEFPSLPNLENLNFTPTCYVSTLRFTRGAPVKEGGRIERANDA